jgi:N-acetylglucosaminyldiphosphoundecaprenol N-acetyl-beta-D-mannosaminyltransferase
MNVTPNSVSSQGEGSSTRISLLGTPFLITNYRDLLKMVQDLALRPDSTVINFCNTQIVVMRRIDSAFIQATREFDYFVPDGMPLIWCLRALGANLSDRVYGPAFMSYSFCHETKLRHYFLGGSVALTEKLVEQAHKMSGGKFQLVGAHHGYFDPGDMDAILAEINQLSPDVIWVGLGTPKQQQWASEYRHRITRGVLLTVGFAFDVNAGTKRDAPMWMQRMGITWLFRVSQEPWRLSGRYLKYNTWFLLLILSDLTRYFLRPILPRPRS